MNKESELDIELLDSNHFGSWMITYSDMITILMCLFIMFFVTSAKENTKLSKLKENLTSKIDTLEEVNEELFKKNQSLSMALFKVENLETDLETSDESFIKFLRDEKLLDQVTINQSNEGLLIRFKDSVLFNSGQAKVTEQGYSILKQIGLKFKELDNDIIVEGYTDNIPMHTIRFPSNWELSASRAISVVKYFIDDIGIDESRLAFSGWGERKSIADNSTEIGRAKNRRIEITILNN